MKKRYRALIVVLVLVVAAFVFLWTFTGFLRADAIDEKDLNYWNYSDGLIEGAGAFEIPGDNEICWMLFHSYGATPREMRGLAERINSEFGDSVFSLRMKGHGEVPSHIKNLSLEDWYEEAEGRYLEFSERCERINVAGSSFGGAISVRLAEDHELKNVYLINAYLSPTDRWYYGFNLEDYLEWFASSWHYAKMPSVARINDPVGLADHIAFWRFVFEPVKNSRGFLSSAVADLHLINESILVQHSLGDIVADPVYAQRVFDEVSSENKKIVLFNESNHVILKDYDSEAAIENVIEFERKNR